MLSKLKLVAACTATVAIPLIATAAYISSESGDRAQLQLIEQVLRQSNVCAFDLLCRNAPIDSYNQAWLDNVTSMLWQLGDTVGVSDVISTVYANKYITGGTVAVVGSVACIDVLEGVADKVNRLANLLRIRAWFAYVQGTLAGPLENATPSTNAFVEQLDQSAARMNDDLKSSILLLLSYAHLQQLNTKQ